MSPRAPRWTISDAVAPLLFIVLVVPVLIRTVHGIRGLADLASLFPALVLGLLAADLSTGLLHWACDTFFSERTPIIGSALIEPFRQHHRDPLAMTRKGFFRVSRASFFAMCTGLTITWWRESGVRADCHSLLAHATWLFYSFAMVLTNQLHMWAHAPRVSAPVAWLQRRGFVISPARHARHHTPPFRAAYCITTGWLNPLLDRMAAFARLERVVRLSRTCMLSVLSRLLAALLARGSASVARRIDDY